LWIVSDQITATWRSLMSGVQANSIEAAITPFLWVGANDSASSDAETGRES